jgi:hypothetical protein
MFLVNSRYRHLSAASFSSIRKELHLTEAHLLPKLRCYFAEFLNQSSLKRLRILSLPTCVGLRYDHPIISLGAFLGSMGSISLFPQAESSSPLGLKEERICLSFQPTGLNHLFQQMADLPFCVPPITQTIIRWYRNINLFSIIYALRPRLRDRLTLSRLALLRKP